MAHLDLTYVKTNVTDDEAFIRELLHVFLESQQVDLIDLEKAIANADHAHIKRAAHKVKSSFRSLGMTEMSALLQQLENLGAEQQPMALIIEQQQKMNRLIPDVRAEVMAYLNG